MSVAELDYPLLREFLRGEPDSWKNFVDRFLGPVLHVIDQTTTVRKIDLSSEDRADLCEAVFRALYYNNGELLRAFDYTSSLTTYLVVLSRRLVVAFLLCDDED